ncbi:SRPBCC family protein [Bradyrhizobium sp. WD16]|uniref:SRPBCC family protein n=1 Tax=Bradyrhizobium sp. WD16 TaxID=1521768 RepID=UPI0020A60DFD|nr:SRPBCC family protein [Bradyrhizobium sp. WD16]UTD26591.1 MxaD protein [Bradyrhizobium sp. WD16]
MTRFWAIIAILLAAPALAHGPTPIKVDETMTIAAAPGVVWAVAGKFDGLASWHPDVKAVKATGGDAAGAEREITLKKGGVLKEGLDEYDAASFKYSYRMSDPDLEALPVSSYSITFAIEPAAGGASNVKWSARLYRGDTGNEPPEELDDDAARNAMSKFLRAGLEGLKKKIEDK